MRFNMSTKTLTDPFHPMTHDFLQDPYPTLASMRANDPLMWSSVGQNFYVTKYATAKAILADLDFEKNLNKWKQSNPMINMIPKLNEAMKSRATWMLNQDPPDHTRMRAIVNKAFTPSRVNDLKPHIEQIANELLDKMNSSEPVDLVSEFAFQIPVIVIAELLGVPASDRHKFRDWSNALVKAGGVLMGMSSGKDSMAQKIQSNMDAIKAQENLLDYFKPIVDERRKDPKNDLISALVEASDNGSKLTKDEVLGNLVLLLVAGHETTVNLIGNAIHSLLLNPDQLNLLKNDFGLLTHTVNEVLRYQSPVQVVRRSSSEDLILSNKEIKKGSMMVILLGSANRDEEVYENADKFDIMRDSSKHLSFGQGIHHCLGSSLAIAEGELALKVLFTRFPDLKLATTQLEYKDPFALRGLKELPIKLK